MNVKNQLQLIEGPTTTWRLDDHTKEVGREGLRLARTKLRAARVLAAEPVMDTIADLTETDTTDAPATETETPLRKAA